MAKRAISRIGVTRYYGSKNKKATPKTVDQIKAENGSFTPDQIIKEIRTEATTTFNTVLKEEQAKGFDKDPIIAVDGVVGKPMSEMKPWGKIEATAKQDDKEVLLDIFRIIIQNSKRVTGQYSDSVWVMKDGNSIVARDFPSFKRFLENYKGSFSKGTQFNFVNTAPYAQHLELEGVTAKSPTRRSKRVKMGRASNRTKKMVRKPNGTMTISIRAVKRKHKYQSEIKYELIYGQKLGLTSPPSGSGVGRVRQKGRSAGRYYVYPSIQYRVTK